MVLSPKKTELVRKHGGLLRRDMVANRGVPDHAVARLHGRGLFGRGLDNRFFRGLGFHCGCVGLYLIYLILFFINHENLVTGNLELNLEDKRQAENQIGRGKQIFRVHR